MPGRCPVHMGMISSIRTAPAATLRRLAHLQRLLEPGAIAPVYQPVVRLADLETVGYEGLARFPYADGLEDMPPDVTLAAAEEIGLRGDLEVACWAAMSAVGSPPGGRLLFANIGAPALAHPGLFLLADRLPSRLVVELTSDDGEDVDPDEVRARLKPWQARGAQLAIDHTGEASLEQLVRLRPDFLKLRRPLVAGIDADPARQALIRGLRAFAREVGAVVVAEGVERPEEFEVLRECDVDLAQGWLFGRPGGAWPEVERGWAGAGEPVAGAGMVRALRHAGTPEAAAAAVADHLHADGGPVRVYLERGDRLRCVAARGHWAVPDGLAPEAGAVGRAYRTGDTVPAGGEDRPVACVPVRAGARVVGVLEAPPAGAEEAAGGLARRLGELGAVDDPSPGQHLARAAARMAAVDDPDAVVREVTAAALAVAGMESALVVLRDAGGAAHVQHAVGPFADALADLVPGELAALAACVEGGTTVLTVGEADGTALPAVEPLRRTGAATVLVVPLAVGRARLGFLALADRSVLAPDTERTELVELLGVQAAAQLRGIAAVVELRDRASRDPLTGLGHGESFRRRLPRRRRAAQRAGRRVAVVVADVDGIAAVNEAGGHAAGDDVLRRTARLLQEVAPAGAGAYRLGGDEFAILLEADGRGDAQGVAWQLQAQARERLGTTLSIGVAVAEDRESDDELLDRVGRAVDEVRRRGCDGVVLAPPRA